MASLEVLAELNLPLAAEICERRRTVLLRCSWRRAAMVTAPLPMPAIEIELPGNARVRIQHPGRDHDNYAGRHLDVDDLTAAAPLNVLAANATPIKRVPPVMNFNFLPDMGRMTRRLLSGKNRGCLPAPTVVDSAPRRCTA